MNREKLSETLKTVHNRSEMADSKTKTDTGHAVGKNTNSDEPNVDQFGLTESQAVLLDEIFDSAQKAQVLGMMLSEFLTHEQAFKEGKLPFSMLSKHHENMKLLPFVEKYLRYLQTEYAQRRAIFVKSLK
jgi:hypothetical protein